MSSGELIVRMGELAAGRTEEVLVTIGLGSCIGLALVDARRGVAGLAHIMLPTTGTSAPSLKFADRAVPELVDRVMALGALRPRLQAVLVGGAHMFGAPGAGSLDVGARNEAATREALKSVRVPVVADATGGGRGRTIRVHTATGEVTFKEAGGSPQSLLGGAPVPGRRAA